MHRLFCLVAALTVLLLPLSALGQTIRWVGTGSNTDWLTTSNWRTGFAGGEEPTDVLNLGNSTGLVRIGEIANESNGTVVFPGAGNPSAVIGNQMFIGIGQSASLTQDGGSITLGYSTSTANTLILGSGPNISGSFTLNDGTFASRGVVLLGNQANAGNQLVINGGTMTVENHINASHNINSGSSIVVANGGRLDIGINGGSVHNLRLGWYANNSNPNITPPNTTSLLIDGGHLRTFVGDITLSNGENGTSSATILAGTMQAGRDLNIGLGTRTTTGFHMSDGTVQALRNIRWSSGNDTTVYADIGGGLLRAENVMELARGNNSVVNLTLSGGAIESAQSIDFGREARGIVFLDMRAGRIQTSMLRLEQAIISLAGGEIVADSMTMASFNAIDFSGGVLKLTGNATSLINSWINTGQMFTSLNNHVVSSSYIGSQTWVFAASTQGGGALFTGLFNASANSGNDANRIPEPATLVLTCCAVLWCHLRRVRSRINVHSTWQG